MNYRNCLYHVFYTVLAYAIVVAHNGWEPYIWPYKLNVPFRPIRWFDFYFEWCRWRPFLNNRVVLCKAAVLLYYRLDLTYLHVSVDTRTIFPWKQLWNYLQEKSHRGKRCIKLPRNRTLDISLSLQYANVIKRRITIFWFSCFAVDLNGSDVIQGISRLDWVA